MEPTLVKNSEALTFVDLLILWNLWIHDNEKELITRSFIMGCVSSDFDYYEIDDSRGKPINNTYTFQQHITKLREFGLVTDKDHFYLTEKGKTFVVESMSDIDRWYTWPLSLPYIAGTFQWSEAFYLGK